MCGRYVSTSTVEELVGEYGVDAVCPEAPLPARWNVAPTQPVYVVAAQRDPEPLRRLEVMRWGLFPPWAQRRAGGAPLINARAETVSAKPAFRSALRRRRCIVPADSYWEWQAGTGQAGTGRAGTGRVRQPFAIRRRGGGTLAFAGLWEPWSDPASPERVSASVTIVTTAANRTLAEVHERMPVVLDAPGVDRWLDPGTLDPDLLAPLLVPAPDEGWELWPVATRVNSVANDGPDLLDAPAG